jgi:hypothetical protein
MPSLIHATWVKLPLHACIVAAPEGTGLRL